MSKARSRGAVPRSTEEVVHRGVTWRRSSTGRVIWYNEGLCRWVTWAPGSDAPPLPAGWEKNVAPVPSAPADQRHAGQGAGNAMVTRPPMRSPYRLVPLIVFVVIIVLAVYQATRTSSASPQQKAQAYALSGHCLERDGGTASAPSYSGTPVSCSSPSASVKVVEVVEAGKTSLRCPARTDVAQIVQAGVQGEPFECLQAVVRRH